MNSCLSHTYIFTTRIEKNIVYKIFSIQNVLRSPPTEKQQFYMMTLHM